MTKLVNALLVLCLSLLLAACATVTPAAPETAAAPSPIATAEPATPAAAATAEATVASEPTADVATGEPGTVKGALFVVSGRGSKPVPGAIIYLARLLTDSTGNESMAAMDRITSPKATTDESGAFLFEDVEPGRYGLVLDTILATYLLNHPRGGDLILEVSPGGTTNTGNLLYQELPVSVD